MIYQYAILSGVYSVVVIIDIDEMGDVDVY